MQSSIINNTMLFQITLLAWVLLKERFSWREVIGIVLAITGVLIVQIRIRKREKHNISQEETLPP